MDQKLTDSLNAVAATWTTLALRQLNAERSEVVNAIYADPDADFCVVIHLKPTAPSSSKALTSAPASAPSCSGKTGARSAPRLPLATRGTDPSLGSSAGRQPEGTEGIFPYEVESLASQQVDDPLLRYAFGAFDAFAASAKRLCCRHFSGRRHFAPALMCLRVPSQSCCRVLPSSFARRHPSRVRAAAMRRCSAVPSRSVTMPKAPAVDGLAVTRRTSGS
jgi:hypothetical protein